MNPSAAPLVSNNDLQLYNIKFEAIPGSKWRFSAQYPISVVFNLQGPKVALFQNGKEIHPSFVANRNCNLLTNATKDTSLMWTTHGKAEFLEVRLTSAFFNNIMSVDPEHFELISGALLKIGKISVAKKALLQTREIQEIIYGISRASVRPESLKSIILHAKAIELLVVYLECLSRNLIPAIVSARNRNLAQMAKTQIDRWQGKKGFTIIGLAQKLGTNETTLKKSFKCSFGKTIFRYFQDEKMNGAMKSLKSGYSVSYTSSACGYSNIAHFSTAFKKEFGINPSSVLHH